MFVNCCHCTECRRQTSSAFAINAVIETKPHHAARRRARCRHRAVGKRPPARHLSLSRLPHRAMERLRPPRRAALRARRHAGRSQRASRRKRISSRARNCAGCICPKAFPLSRPITTWRAPGRPKAWRGAMRCRISNACPLRLVPFAGAHGLGTSPTSRGQKTRRNHFPPPRSGGGGREATGGGRRALYCPGGTWCTSVKPGPGKFSLSVGSTWPVE